jgi:ParB family transcriptional regulator, chromosome partitioning protein
LFVFDEIKAKNLSVRQTENLVRNLYKEGTPPVKEEKDHLPPTYKKIEDKLGSHFSTRVKMKHSKNGSGQITFDYYSLEELNKLLDQMSITID